MFATGEFAQLGHDGFAVEEELVAHDGVAGDHGEAVAVDRDGVGIGRVGDADEPRPAFANGLLGRRAADLVFDEELLDGAGKYTREESDALEADALAYAKDVP